MCELKETILSMSKTVDVLSDIAEKIVDSVGSFTDKEMYLSDQYYKLTPESQKRMCEVIRCKNSYGDFRNRIFDLAGLEHEGGENCT